MARYTSPAYQLSRDTNKMIAVKMMRKAGYEWLQIDEELGFEPFPGDKSIARAAAMCSEARREFGF